MKTRFFTICTGLAALLLASCATFPIQSTYESVSVGREAVLRIDIGRELHGFRAVRISGGSIPGAVLTGEAAARSPDDWEVTLIGLDWFNNWKNGWTDASFVIDGNFDLLRSGSLWSIRTTNALEIVAPSSATIHYYEDYINGKEALEQFNRRWNRIEAYATFLHSRFDDAWYGDRRRVRSFLFPELYGYERPPAPHHASVTAKSIAWNTDYTAQEFPENLRLLRDSGTMLRDFEESPGLWDLAFHWSELWAMRIQAESFRSVKP